MAILLESALYMVLVLYKVLHDAIVPVQNEKS